jgi:hypothetical protein
MKIKNEITNKINMMYLPEKGAGDKSWPCRCDASASFGFPFQGSRYRQCEMLIHGTLHKCLADALALSNPC